MFSAWPNNHKYYIVDFTSTLTSPLTPDSHSYILTFLDSILTSFESHRTFWKSFVLSHDEIGQLVSEKNHISQEIVYLTFDLAVTLPLTSNLKSTTISKIKISRPFEWYMARCNQSAGLEDKQGGQNLPPPVGRVREKTPVGRGLRNWQLR